MPLKVTFFFSLPITYTTTVANCHSSLQAPQSFEWLSFNLSSLIIIIIMEMWDSSFLLLLFFCFVTTSTDIGFSRPVLPPPTPFDHFHTSNDNFPSRNLQVKFPLENHHHIVQVATLAFVIILAITLALVIIVALVLLYCSCFPASAAIAEIELPV